MGRSASCFRIITCSGGDSAEKEADDLDVVENKSSNDKHGWSFSKKSKHRILSNTVISEAPMSGNKGTVESVPVNSPFQDNSTTPEKVWTVQSTQDMIQMPVPCVVQPTEDKTQFSAANASKPTEDEMQLPVPVDSKASETDDGVSRIKNEIDIEVSSPELGTDDVVAETEKDIDHDKATETDDAPVVEKGSDYQIDEKMDDSVVVVIQAAVRGFLAQRKLLKLKKVVKLQAAVRGHLERRHAIGALRCVQAIVKMQALVRARRARQSIEDSISPMISEKESSGTEPKAISASAEKLLQNKFARQLLESRPKAKPVRIKCDPSKTDSAWSWLERWMSVSPAEKTSNPSLSTEQTEKAKAEDVTCTVEIASNVPLETSNEVVSHLDQSGPSDENEPSSLPKRDESQSEDLKHSITRLASNPEFLAAQSKFEELTSSGISNRSIDSSSYKDVVLDEPKTDGISSTDESKTPNDGRFQLGGSELSISSTLDSFGNRAEIGVTEYEYQTGLPKQETRDRDQTEKPDYGFKGLTLSNSTEDCQEKLDHDKKMQKSDIGVEEPTLSNTKADREEKLDHVKEEIEGSAVSEIQQQPQIGTPVTKYPETETGNQTYSLSETGNQTYPLSPESQATPSSKISSVKAKNDKTNKSGSSQKRKITSSATKKSPSNPKHDSGDVSVAEQAGKDRKSRKKQNSSAFDQEPRESSGGNNTVPRFMQPTESARAKLHEHGSPRSSPDVQEREIDTKKRHSLPGANGKQGSSPRIQRSSSQAQQGTKERKWQR